MTASISSSAVFSVPANIRRWSIECLLLALSCLFPCTTAYSSDINGEWQLTITGNNLFFYGTSMLTAGVKQDWEAVIEFQVKNNQFDLGTGKARLTGKPVPYSHPAGMFQCQSTEGVYLDRGLHEVSTPHIRYSAFPVAGQIQNGRVLLKPDVKYIGNFIAMMYECTTSDALGDVWHDRGRLSSLERSKRQDAKHSVNNRLYKVDVKELQFVEPRGEFEIPLQDGLKITQTDQASFAVKTFELSRKK
jgi:hypothetical protein